MSDGSPDLSGAVGAHSESAKLRTELKALSDQLADVAKQNQSIKDRIDSFAPLAEDAMGLRVFDKAKSYLVNWITIGGIAAVVAGVALFTEAWNYARGIIDSDIQTAAREKLPRLIADEVKGKMSGFLQREVSHQVQSHIASHPEEFSQIERTVVASVYVERTKSGETVLHGNATENTPAATDSIIDYTAQMLPVRDEGTEGSVVGFALADVIEYQWFKASGQKVRFSPREIYNLARTIEHMQKEDSGALISDGVRVVRAIGAVTEQDWPYKIGEFAQAPPRGFDKMRKYRTRVATRLKTLDDIKSALRKSGPVVIGFTVYAGLQSGAAAKTGIVPMPKANESVVGGHAVAIVGYDDTKKMLKFENEWGPDWGDKGYGYLPYSYITPNLVDDMWSVSF